MLPGLWPAGGAGGPSAQQVEDITDAIETYRRVLALAAQKLEDLDLPEALARFTEVIDAYNAGKLPAASPLTRQIVGQAYEGRARTLANLGRNADARADYEALIRYDPTWPVDRERTSPKILALYDEARRRLVGTLAVQTDPPGAMISLDGQPAGRSPLFDKELTAGSHRIEVEAPGFEPIAQTIEIAGGTRLETSLRLTPNARSVLVVTSPAGSRVSVDSQQRGVTFGEAGEDYAEVAEQLGLSTSDLSAPLLVEHLSPGEHLIRVEKECFEPQLLSVNVVVDPNGNAPIRFHPLKLTPSLGSLSLDTTPTGAQIELDGKPAGTTPARLDGICSGPHEVRMRKPGLGQWIGQVSVTRGQKTSITAPLRMTLAYVGMPAEGPAGRPPLGEVELGEALEGLASLNVIGPDRGLPGEWLARAKAGQGRSLTPEYIQGVARETGADIVLAAGPDEGAFERRVIVTLYDAAHPQMPPDTLPVSLDDETDTEKLLALLEGQLPMTRPWIGLRLIETHNTVNPTAIRIPPDGPAGKAGVRLGQRIVSLGGTPVRSPADLAKALAGLKEGAQASLTIQQPGGAPRQVNVLVGSSPVVAGLADASVRYSLLAARMGFRARMEAARGHPDRLARNTALLNLGVALMHAGRHEDALKEALDQVDLPAGNGISAGTVAYLKALCLEALGRSQEARTQLELAAGQPDATLGSHDGPPVAERAARLLSGD
ncbi:MAG TPA: PEGA domain-containing protein [Candidatus Polarisedimenticolia bacterium]|nr:PEGA domain-containing protein [Candidatus Polarisedimenticolia bacterium]